jgi:hypothetical protein
VRPHDLDIVSLLVGLVFVTLGGTGLLQSAGVIGTGLSWPLIGAVAAVGLTGLVVSTRRMVGSSVAPAPAPAPDADENLDHETFDGETFDGEDGTIDVGEGARGEV